MYYKRTKSLKHNYSFQKQNVAIVKYININCKLNSLFVINGDNQLDLVFHTVSPTKQHIPSYVVHDVQNIQDIELFLMDANSRAPNLGE